MKFRLSHKAKLIVGIFLVGILILAGTIISLAKSGVINLSSLADELHLSQSASGNVNIFVQSYGGTSPSGSGIVVDIYYHNSWYAWQRTDSNSDAVFNLPTQPDPYFALARGSGCPAMSFTVPATFWVARTCPVAPTGSFVVKGKVLDETTGNPVSGITVEISPGGTAAVDTTDASGNYSVNVQPVTYASSASYVVNFSDNSRSRPVPYQFDHKRLDQLIGNITNIPTNSPYNAAAEYMYLAASANLSLGGSIYVANPNGSGDMLLGGATVSILNSVTNDVITTVNSSPNYLDSSPQYFSINFKTPEFVFNSTDIGSLAIKITSSGYNDLGPTTLQNSSIIYPSAEGGVTTGQLNVLKEYAMTKKSAPPTFDLVGLVTDNTTSNALTGASVIISCPTGTSSQNCILPTPNPSLSASPPVNKHGVTSPLNFGAIGLYNISQSGATFSQYNLVISKEGYASKNITIASSEIKTDAAGALYALKNVSLVSNSNSMHISGSVLNAASGLGINAARVKIVPLDNLGTTLAEVQTNSSGQYDFSNSVLTNKIDRSKEYRITAYAPDPNFSTATESFILSNRSELLINFRLAANPDHLVVFEGNIYNLSGGRSVPIANATVEIVDNDRGLIAQLVDPSTVLSTIDTDGNGHYRLEVRGLYQGGDQQAVPVRNIKLMAFNAQSSLASRFLVKTFRLEPNQGARINQDFTFNNNGSSLSSATSKNVTLEFDQQVRQFKSVYTGTVNPSPVIIRSTPWAGLKVQLRAVRNSTDPNTSGVVVYSAKATTDSQGIVRFDNFPSINADIILELSADQSIWNFDSGQLKLSSGAKSKTVTAWRNAWDSGPLKAAENNINMGQHAQPWSSAKPWDFNNPVESQGCCITTLAMAIKYYYPNRTVTPATLVNLSNSKRVSLHVSQMPAFMDTYSQSTGAKLHLVPLDKTKLSSELNRYLNLGIPIIWYSVDGHLQKYYGGTYQTHCVLLTHAHSGAPAKYGLIDSWDGTVLEFERPQLGNLDDMAMPHGVDQGVAYAVVSDQALAAISSSRGSSINTITTQAFAATTQNFTVAPLTPIPITANITNRVAIPIQNVFLTLNLPNNVKRSIKMAKTTSGSYRASIPSNLVTANLSYKIEGISDYGVKFWSSQTNVTVSGSRSITAQVTSTASAAASQVSVAVEDTVIRSGMIIDSARRNISDTLYKLIH